MKVLITGICGYVGSRTAFMLKEEIPGIEIIGIDNFSRKGSLYNKEPLLKRGIKVIRGDIGYKSKFNAIPKCSWVIDCAAKPEVMSGLSDKGCTSEELLRNNLTGTLNILEYCKKHSAGFVLISTNRVYSIDELSKIPLKESAARFELNIKKGKGILGLSNKGISEEFSTLAPVSLYGATKLSSEIMALEYSKAFGFPVWINRCGVIGGPGQFGKADQGIFSFWVYNCLLNKKLKYIGFGGKGKQVRDCVMAEDVANLVIKQMKNPDKTKERIFNVGGTKENSMSLFELTAFCSSYLNRKIDVGSDKNTRPYDIPYFVTDIEKVNKCFDWKPNYKINEIIEKIFNWAVVNKVFVKSITK